MTLKMIEVDSSKKEMTHTIHQDSIRFKINYPLESEMTLTRLKEDMPDAEKAEVLIENIGPGGLRFVSNLKLVVSQEIVYSFETEILGDKVHLPGVIIWEEELFLELYQYGVQFNIPENARPFLTQLLNDYSVKYFSVTRE